MILGEFNWHVVLYLVDHGVERDNNLYHQSLGALYSINLLKECVIVCTNAVFERLDLEQREQCHSTITDLMCARAEERAEPECDEPQPGGGGQ